MKQKRYGNKWEMMPGTILWYDVNAPRKKGIPQLYSSMELKHIIKTKLKNKKNQQFARSI